MAQAEVPLNIRQTAPLNSWIALSSDESRIVAVATTLEELESKLLSFGDDEVVLFKTPPIWAHFAF